MALLDHSLQIATLFHIMCGTLIKIAEVCCFIETICINNYQCYEKPYNIAILIVIGLYTIRNGSKSNERFAEPVKVGK